MTSQQLDDLMRLVRKNQWVTWKWKHVPHGGEETFRGDVLSSKERKKRKYCVRSHYDCHGVPKREGDPLAMQRRDVRIALATEDPETTFSKMERSAWAEAIIQEVLSPTPLEVSLVTMPVKEALQVVLA